MAIFAIPNPTKKITIDFPLDRVKKGVERASLYNRKYQLAEKNNVFNSYKFNVSESLSLGSYLLINLSSLSETKTEVAIEVQRKIGTFDKSHEVSLANEHISVIIDCISKAILLTDADVEAIYKAHQEKVDKKANRKFKKRYILYALIISFIAFCIYAINFADVK